MTPHSRIGLRRHATRSVAGSLLAGSIVAGCIWGCGGPGSSKNSSSGNPAASTTDLQNPPAAGPVNSYVGIQSQNTIFRSAPQPQVSFGGLYALKFDTATDYFSYQDLNVSGNNGIVDNGTTGSFKSASPGFYRLATDCSKTTAGVCVLYPLQAAANAGYALEIPGRAALVRPGPNTVALVPAVQTSECLQLSGPINFQFIAMGSPYTNDMVEHVAYGSIQIATQATPESSSGTQPGNSGTLANFTNLKMFQMDGTALQPGQFPQGACASTLEGFAINVPASDATFGKSQTVVVGPSGFLVIDQGQGDQSFVTDGGMPGATGPLGLVGVIQPSTAIDTADLVAKKFAGFYYDAIQISAEVAGTQPVAFGQAASGQVAGSGHVIAGGTFPNDDVTQPPASGMSIDLRTQDTQNHGLYKSVTVILPDQYHGCEGQPWGGVDQNMSPTCVFHGIAIAGKPEGKYALFVNVLDPSEQNRRSIVDGSRVTPLATLQFFLYQQ